MARKIVFVVKEKDVQLAEPFIFLDAAIQFAQGFFKKFGLAGSSYWEARSNQAPPLPYHMELHSGTGRVLTIDETDG